MKKIIDKIITGFFVVVLGSIWYCSTRYRIEPKRYTIIMYDAFGMQIKTDEIRTDFRTHEVARSYCTEYEKRFPQYGFSMATNVPEFKRRVSLRVFKRIQR